MPWQPAHEIQSNRANALVFNHFYLKENDKTIPTVYVPLPSPLASPANWFEECSGRQPRKIEAPNLPTFVVRILITRHDGVCWSPYDFCHFVEGTKTRAPHGTRVHHRQQVTQLTMSTQLAMPNARFLTCTLFTWSLHSLLAMVTWNNKTNQYTFIFVKKFNKIEQLNAYLNVTCEPPHDVGEKFGRNKVKDPESTLLVNAKTSNFIHQLYSSICWRWFTIYWKKLQHWLLITWEWEGQTDQHR